MNIEHLHVAVAAVAPILGVSVGAPEDKATWRVDFAPAATQAERDAAAAVVVAFDPARFDVPLSVSRRQARLALLDAELLGTIETAIATAGQVAQIEWQEADAIRRYWPTLLSVANDLNMSAAALDDLFRAAAAKGA